MHLALALTASQKGAVILLISGVAAPIAGYLFARSADAWSSIGKGPLSIEPKSPPPAPPGAPPRPVDRAVLDAEVRQMLAAKSERLSRRGEAPLDVEAEAARLLADAGPASPAEALEAELRSEVRQLVVARSERRCRQGLPPLDVEAETERQLADLVGSR